MELFAKNAFFGHFGDFQAGFTSAKQKFALLAAGMVFYDILARACAEIKILRFFWTSK